MKWRSCWWRTANKKKNDSGTIDYGLNGGAFNYFYTMHSTFIEIGSEVKHIYTFCKKQYLLFLNALYLYRIQCGAIFLILRKGNRQQEKMAFYCLYCSLTIVIDSFDVDSTGSTHTQIVYSTIFLFLPLLLFFLAFSTTTHNCSGP